MNFSCWKCADDGCLGTMVSLLIGLLYASLQLPLDNRENKNSGNVCLSQIRENISPQNLYLYSIVWLTQFGQKSGLIEFWGKKEREREETEREREREGKKKTHLFIWFPVQSYSHRIFFPGSTPSCAWFSSCI